MVRVDFQGIGTRLKLDLHKCLVLRNGKKVSIYIVTWTCPYACPHFNQLLAIESDFYK